MAQRLFHSRGYDAVSVADLTKEIGINPPSFYAAFGSKLGLYTQVLMPPPKRASGYILPSNIRKMRLG